MAEEEIGKISHYFSKIAVCVVVITNGDLKVGEKIHIKGATSDVIMVVDSMQVDHDTVEEAKKGDSIGMKVPDRVREQDIVYKVTE
jgi:translation initiation factor IF-2